MSAACRQWVIAGSDRVSHSVCPWWLGYCLISPLGRWSQNPAEILDGYLRQGITALEPGPGMAFFKLELLRWGGTVGKVVAVDVQNLRVLQRLKPRAAKAGLLNRLDARLASPDSMALYRDGRLPSTLPSPLPQSRNSPMLKSSFVRSGRLPNQGLRFCWRSPEARSNPRSSKASWMQPARAASVCTRGLRCRAAMQLFCTGFRVGAVSSSRALRSRAWRAPESRESSQSSPNRATLESQLSAPSSSPRLQDA